VCCSCVTRRPEGRLVCYDLVQYRYSFREVKNVRTAFVAHLRTLTLLTLSLVLSACALPSHGTLTATQAASAPAIPTPTSTPTAPLVILVLPADMPADETNQYETAIYDLAQQNSMRFQVLNSLTPADVDLDGPALKIVIAFPPDPGLASLSAAAPQTQFLAVSIPGLKAASNLSTIGASGPPSDQQAFLAGYIAALLSEDYRTGIVTSKDNSQGAAAETAFTNGMHFYCGLCNPAIPPWYSYPLLDEIPADATASQVPLYADYLQQHMASVVYVSPQTATIGLYSALSQDGLKIIGESLPSPSLKSSWVASLKPELLSAVQKIFPDLLAGRGGQTIPSPLFLTDLNPDLLSAGKQRLVQDVLNKLQAGQINPVVTP